MGWCTAKWKMLLFCANIKEDEEEEREEEDFGHLRLSGSILL